MKHQQVSVDYWAMGKSMLTYAVLASVGWMIMRIFSVMFSLPRRMRLTQDNMQATLEELQRRYPNLNVTEEDLINAEKDYEEWTKEFDAKFENGEPPELLSNDKGITPSSNDKEKTPSSNDNEKTPSSNDKENTPAIEEDKKTI